MVEDEIKLANAMKRALELQKYAVDAVHDGNEALDMILGESYDLVILDLMLPGLDGIEICRKVRKEGLAVPILMLTAKGQVSDKVAGLDEGADDYVVKPFSFEELFARVRALVRRPQENDGSVLKTGSLLLDPVKFKVNREGKLIQLSSKEFSLLEYLMRNKNAVVTKEQIIAHVWDYDADVLPNVVEVHMKHLRDKIDAPFKNPLIFTRRGFGYEIKGN